MGMNNPYKSAPGSKKMYETSSNAPNQNQKRVRKTTADTIDINDEYQKFKKANYVSVNYYGVGAAIGIWCMESLSLFHKIVFSTFYIIAAIHKIKEKDLDKWKAEREKNNA
ncbi:MAG: hypothetical protein [Caudoviricetes sp.]|nr:MAG: hypothetical protein [Caudoviricetes sp.]